VKYPNLSAKHGIGKNGKKMTGFSTPDNVLGLLNKKCHAHSGAAFYVPSTAALKHTGANTSPANC
jgi:hypothetical protein